MILLKANENLKAVFQKIIKTMGENVQWTNVFIMNNNELVLLGKGRSLFFNFDNKRAYSNIIDVEINDDKIDVITQNEMLENALNMTLYTFGKWGQIKGLKVEKDYEQLKKLLNYILKEIKVEADLTEDNLRFYQDGIQITYEEIIQQILDKSIVNNEEEEAINEEEPLTEEEEKSLGLWHKMVWKSSAYSFVKDEISEEDKNRSRLGKEFYMVNYKCPICGEKLHMVVYPIGEEFRIETEEGGVYLARAYTCSACNSFYTPKPYKLLVEGDVYSLLFEEDKAAYEDYLELLGKQGQRTSNCNFNQFEADYNKKKQENLGNEEIQPSLEEISSDIDLLTDEEIEELVEKIDSGFYPEENIEKYYGVVKQEQRNRRLNGKTKGKYEGKENKNASDEGRNSQEKANEKEKYNTSLDKQNAKSQKSKQEKSNNNEDLKQDTIKSATYLAEDSTKIMSFEGLKDIFGSLLNGEHQNFELGLEKLSFNQLKDLQTMVRTEQKLNEEQKRASLELIDRHLYKEKEKAMLEKVVSCKGKTYAQIKTVKEEIKKEEVAESVKTSILDSLMQLLEKTGKKELENIMAQIPSDISRKQYELFRDKLEDYQDIDTKLARNYLEERRDEAEKQEIAAFIKKVNPRDRKSHLSLYYKLKEQKFEEKNAEPYLEKIYSKVYDMDELAIRKICPEPADIDFEEGLKAYEEISLGEFLPELKDNMLHSIDARLTKLKADECEQLINKLAKDIGPYTKNDSRLYLNNIRKMLRDNLNDTDLIMIHNALNSYAKKNDKYEYPILVCDASYGRNGDRGFLLTPNRIYYNTLFGTGVIDVMSITGIFARNGLMNKGLYVNKGGEKIKISNSLKSKDLKSIARVLNDFIAYLKEKPESRNISYLAKEVHEVKCCYRCGYVYKGGNVCPKCGSKFNE
jgi:hypothetical protein